MFVLRLTKIKHCWCQRIVSKKIDLKGVTVKDWDGNRSNGEVYAEDFIPTSTIDKVKSAF